MRNATAVWHKNDDAVSPVIGTILMVAITVVLAAVLWLMVSGMIGGQEEQKITVNLGSPSTPEKFNRGATDVWDTSMNVNRITPKDQKVLWTELKILIKSSTGSLLLTSTAPTADNPAAYSVATPPLVQVWYVEMGANTKLDAGDTIKITGMSTLYEGATVEMTKAGNLIASASLPTNFP